MNPSADSTRLLAGPPIAEGAESLGAHRARLGELPGAAEVRDLIPALEASGLLGRGGAGFPVGRKWRALADRRDGRAVVVANGAEGEPASAKDRALMTRRPHLILDGALLAAQAVGADELIIYIGEEHGPAVAAMDRAMRERAFETRLPMWIVTAPVSYVAGEATAAVHYINAADARPTMTPPRMSERGVAGRPTLVQNVESLAYAALIARYGDRWYRSVGQSAARGTALLTISGAVRDEGVHEVELGTTLQDAIGVAGGMVRPIQAVIVGGYFGTWARAEEAWTMPLDPEVMKARGLAFGCGLVGVLPTSVCGVVATARIIGFLAAASAGQCGPCLYGLRSISDATAALAGGRAGTAELANVERWIGQIAGRGACRHPDGAIQLMASALAVFGDEFAHHARTGRCSATGQPARIEAA
jgi:NADH:ubiquinone oxidoreductase subunit F (NADH-binding)